MGKSEKCNGHGKELCEDCKGIVPKNSMEKLFDLFKKVLIAHINTKTTNHLFHVKSQVFYELLFDCFHQISEKEQDFSQNMEDAETLISDTYDALEEAKTIIEKMVKEKNTIGMDNLLRGLADKLEFACLKCSCFIKEERISILSRMKR